MKETVRFAFLKTIPVMLGYLFLGLAFGLLLQEAGYSFWWALLASTIVYAGSIQFVLVSFLGGGTSLPAVAVMTLLINSRHAFYGLSFVEKFRKMKTYPYTVSYTHLDRRDYQTERFYRAGSAGGTFRGHCRYCGDRLYLKRERPGGVGRDHAAFRAHGGKSGEHEDGSGADHKADSGSEGGAFLTDADSSRYRMFV